MHRVASQQNHANSETKPLFEKHYHMVINLHDNLDGVEYMAGVKLGKSQHTNSRYSNIKSKYGHLMYLTFLCLLDIKIYATAHSLQLFHGCKRLYC